MELRYFPRRSTDCKPYSDRDGLFDYSFSADATVEQFVLDLGPSEESESRFGPNHNSAVSAWIPFLGGELTSSLDDYRDSAWWRLCSTRIEFLHVKRAFDHDVEDRLRIEPHRLLHKLNTQAEHIGHLPARLLTLDVIGLAKDMIETAETHAMPILADALEEAGCNWRFLLRHCRECADHGERCWVLDLIQRSRIVAQGD